MDEEIKQMFEDHERRIKILEGKPLEQKKPESNKKDYKGLAGGIRLIIDNEFLKDPKTVNEIVAELKREGYHHSVAPVSKMLSVDFTKNKKVLNRIMEGKVWKYVLRK